MFQKLIEFIYSASDEQLKAFQRKANAVTGTVTLQSNVTLTPITNALQKRLGLKTVQTSLARKLAYASELHHYLHGTTMFEDILAGKTRRRPSSYIKK